MKIKSLAVSLVLVLLFSVMAFNAPLGISSGKRSSFDILILNGTVIDGTGDPRFAADIGIKDGKIVAIGDLDHSDAEEVIDATGLIVCPGFIDIHTHCEAIAYRPEAMNYIRQGVTTVLAGNCGGSPIPIGDFLDRLSELLGIAINYATLVGFGDVRIEVMGWSYEPATPEQISEMRAIVARAMEEGAFGMSTGLEYYPDLAASTEEVIEVTEAIAPYGGFYASHTRCEFGYGVLDAHREAIEIGEGAGVPVEISHIKIDGRAWWGLSIEDIAMINEARARGVEVTADIYPYDAWASGMTVFLPVWAWEPFEGKEGFEAVLARLADPEQRALIKEEMTELIDLEVGTEFFRIMISSCRWEPEFTGKDLEWVMDYWGLPATAEGACEAAIRIIENGSCGVVVRSMSEEDMENFMKQPWVMFCSDGSIVKFGRGRPHPRNYGTFPRVLAYWVREKEVLTLEEAINKMTFVPAKKMHLLELGRGLIKEGFWADIVVFNSETVVDKATFIDPHQYPEGFEAVLVNGKTAVRHDEFQGVYAGQVLRHTPLAIKAYIECLPSEAFAREQLRKPLVAKADTVIKMIKDGEYRAAINKLLHDIKPKVEGAIGKAWVIDPEAREILCSLIDNTVHGLQLEMPLVATA